MVIMSKLKDRFIQICFLLVFILGQFVAEAQTKNYQLTTIAFYNVENLFDTINDPNTLDDSRTPFGRDQWNTSRYQHKISSIAKVISEIGGPYNSIGPDVIGLCEIENRTVLEDLIADPQLIKQHYGIVHLDSPDERGIDVALLYKKKQFIPTAFKSYRLLLFNEDGYRDFTRDQLLVRGLLGNEIIYFIVNHWPSRRGGQLRSEQFRLTAAKLNKRIIDSIQHTTPQAKIISMGDFNDDSIDSSFKKILKTSADKNKDSIRLFNAMEPLFKKGIGSLAYRDQWNLFDQFYFTANLLSKDSGHFYWKAGVYAPKYLLTKQGKYTNYPFRTYAGGTYYGGYSDHFPVYLYLLKEE